MYRKAEPRVVLGVKITPGLMRDLVEHAEREGVTKSKAAAKLLRLAIEKVNQKPAIRKSTR